MMPKHIEEKMKARVTEKAAFKALIRAADDVALQYETATCGPDLADSIRCFLIPAVRNAKWALKQGGRA